MTGYALILQGGGVGVLYLVIFGAFKLYSLLPPTFAFVLLVAVVVLSAILALLQTRWRWPRSACRAAFLAPIWSRPDRAITSRCSATTRSSTPAFS
jgi:uncharacterized membrane protein